MNNFLYTEQSESLSNGYFRFGFDRHQGGHSESLLPHIFSIHLRPFSAKRKTGCSTMDWCTQIVSIGSLGAFYFFIRCLLNLPTLWMSRLPWRRWLSEIFV